MNKIKWMISGLFVIATVALCGADEKKETKLDPAKVVGKWTITSGKVKGEKAKEENLKGVIEFTKDKITIGEEHEMTYKIDVSKTPAEIDMTGTKGPAKDFSAKGLIQFDGEELKLVYDGLGGDRPKEFDSKKDSNVFFFVMKKAK